MSHPPDLSLEERLWAQDYRRVAGLDEVGRGAWAGPVVAAAVILPPDRPGLIQDLAGVRDSKLLSPRQRQACYAQITACAIAYALGSASAEEIDQQGIVFATRLAMMRAVRALPLVPDYLLIDALRLTEIATPQFSTPKADLLHLSVSAASIVAKVRRDGWMVTLDGQFPGYGFAKHKGYGTVRHLAALHQLGASMQHRMSFAPLQALAAGAATSDAVLEDSAPLSVSAASPITHD
jgi:ribonuclease HII